MLGNLLKSVWYEVFHGGKTFIYDLEFIALQKMLFSLNDEGKHKFSKQLMRLDLVQRSPEGKIVALYESKDTYFKSWGEILLNNENENFLACKMKVTGKICPKKSLTIEIFLHKGRISSIEYKGKMDWPSSQNKKELNEIDWLSDRSGIDLDIINFELLM